MGNVSPHHSKSFHDGLNHHLGRSTASTAATTTVTTPNRSSWKKQLQLINDTLNIKKFSRRHAQSKIKRSKGASDENAHPILSISRTTQNFQDLLRHQPEKSNPPNNADRPMNFKKSFSLFSIKQPLHNATNKEIISSKVMNNTTNSGREKVDEQQPATVNSITTVKEPLAIKENPTNEMFSQQKRRQKFEVATGSNTLVNKRHSALVLPSYHIPKSQSQFYHPHHHIQLSSHTRLTQGLSSSTKNIRSIDKTTTRKTIIQASTSELLRCLGEYLCSSCAHLLPILDPIDCILWIKSADRQLVLQGWQEQVFVNPANIVFVYLLVRETLTHVVPSPTIRSVTELHAIILTCLYLAFSYMGNEITYPLKPFVTDDETREAFWQRVVLIMGQLSAKMLAINQNPKFFTECFSELKGYNLVH